MIILDTSVLVRFFTKDEATLFKKAKDLLETKEELFVPDVVFVELEYVLGKLYKATRVEIKEAFRFLVSGRFEVNKYGPEAVELFTQSNLSIADCFVAAQAKGEKLASFDMKLIKSSGRKNYW